MNSVTSWFTEEKSHETTPKPKRNDGAIDVGENQCPELQVEVEDYKNESRNLSDKNDDKSKNQPPGIQEQLDEVSTKGIWCCKGVGRWVSV